MYQAIFQHSNGHKAIGFDNDHPACAIADAALGTVRCGAIDKQDTLDAVSEMQFLAELLEHDNRLDTHSLSGKAGNWTVFVRKCKE